MLLVLQSHKSGCILRNAISSHADRLKIFFLKTTMEIDKNDIPGALLTMLVSQFSNPH